MKRTSGKSALRLLEEATHVLRSAPAGTIAVYYAGTVPFVLGLLYFWTDMSRNPLAGSHVAEMALGLALLFLAMKLCHARFAALLRAQFAHKPPTEWELRHYGSLLVQQSLLHSTGLFVLPLCLVFVPLFGLVYSFYQNVTVLADPSEGSFALARRAWRHTVLWLRPQYLVLSLTFLFGFFVFLNLLAAVLWLPGILKMFFDLETPFSRSTFALLNSTSIAAVCFLVYLCVDPLIKAIYAVRGFYADSVASGEDLKADLQQFSPGSRRFVATVILATLLTLPGAAAPRSTQDAPDTRIPPAELDQKIEEVIRQPQYAWRMPRSRVPQTETEEGFLSRFFSGTARFIGRALQSASRWIGSIFERIFGGQRAPAPGTGFGSLATSLPYILLVLAIAGLGYLLFRLRRKATEPEPVVATEAMPHVPDIRDENVGADQLPEDGWARLALELLNQGELRLAMRAGYLASLAHLAKRNLIGLARFKSNREYERELRRRAHAFPELVSTFGENLTVFERIWYGTHPASRETVTGFINSLDRLRKDA
jgi:hypothetical protein